MTSFFFFFFFFGLWKIKLYFLKLKFFYLAGCAGGVIYIGSEWEIGEPGSFYSFRRKHPWERYESPQSHQLYPRLNSSISILKNTYSQNIVNAKFARKTNKKILLQYKMFRVLITHKEFTSHKNKSINLFYFLS